MQIEYCCIFHIFFSIFPKLQMPSHITLSYQSLLHCITAMKAIPALKSNYSIMIQDMLLSFMMNSFTSFKVQAYLILSFGLLTCSIQQTLIRNHYFPVVSWCSLRMGLFPLNMSDQRHIRENQLDQRYGDFFNCCDKTEYIVSPGTLRCIVD